MATLTPFVPSSKPVVIVINYPMNNWNPVFNASPGLLLFDALFFLSRPLFKFQSKCISLYNSRPSWEARRSKSAGTIFKGGEGETWLGKFFILGVCWKIQRVCSPRTGEPEKRQWDRDWMGGGESSDLFFSFFLARFFRDDSLMEDRNAVCVTNEQNACSARK